MKTMLKSMLAMGVVVVSLLITAVSCDKKTNNGNRVGDLKLYPVTGHTNYITVKGNTVYINALELMNKITPLSDSNDNNRSFNDIAEAHSAFSKKYVGPFAVVYPGATATMVFVNRSHVTKDTIALRSFNDCSEDSESGDNAFAQTAEGGSCRFYKDNTIVQNSILGTIFDDGRTNSARGAVACSSFLYRQNGSGSEHSTITDTLKFNGLEAAICYMGVVNNGLGSSVEINNSWVLSAGPAAREVELYAIGIDVSEKTIPEFSSASGFNQNEFVKALDNAAFKKMLEKNQWRDLRFKVKIVTSIEYQVMRLYY